ncbi:MAG: polysaccharide deacetylase family protein [Syntrophomonas sp.]
MKERREFIALYVVLMIIAAAVWAAGKYYPGQASLAVATVAQEPQVQTATPEARALLYASRAGVPPIKLTRDIKGIPILMYHNVSPDPSTGSIGHRMEPETFERQMRYLKEHGYHTVDLGAVLDFYQKGAALPEKPIVITLDDGYQGNYYYAFPVLKKYGFTATVFVVSNIVGGLNDFDIKAGLKPPSRMLSWEQIKEMDAAGITIGCHTLDHAHLSKVSSSEARRQIVECKKVLEQILGREIQFFCYPYGEYNAYTLQVLRECGFRAAVTVNPLLVTGIKDPLQLNRIGIPGYMEDEDFANRILGP